MLGTIFIQEEDEAFKKAGSFIYDKNCENVYNFLVRIFSLKKSFTDNISGVILLLNGKEKLVVNSNLIKNYVIPISRYIYNLRHEAIFDNRNYFFLNELIENNFELSSLLKALPKHIQKLVLSFQKALTIMEYRAFESVKNDNIGKRRKVRRNYNVYCYNIKIAESPDYEDRYYVKPFTDLVDVIFCYKSLGDIMIEYDRRRYLKEVAVSEFDEIVDHRLEIFRYLAENFCPDVLSLLSTEKIKKLAYLSTFCSLKVTRIMPFLLDDRVQEFYQDAPNTNIYLDHEIYGRCRSNIALSKKELEVFLTHIKMDTGNFISFSSPSLKTDYITKMFKVRVSIDAPPVAIDGISIDVRKYRKKAFTIPELIKLGTLSAEAAAFLFIAAFFRLNILISGEPGSGKTTLLNAIDIMLPKIYRKIYIEDVVESIKQLDKGYHQLRLRVGSLERSQYSRSSKIDETIKILHRKPDYVIMGELQHREHVIAAFQAMNAGIKCIQTTHALNLEQLVLRFVKIFDIPMTLLSSIDVIVFMKRDLLRKDKKKVTFIYEKSKSGSCGNPLTMFSLVYARNKDDILKRVTPLEKSTTINKLSLENKIPMHKIILLIEKVKEIFKAYSADDYIKSHKLILRKIGELINENFQFSRVY